MLDNRKIALVNEQDEITGYEDKLFVHEKGLLHRAFSIFVFNEKNEILIHRRALEKYHTPGLWTNTCCSHLLEDMTMEECTHDRLNFEMGFDCKLSYQFSFTYKTTFGNGLTEHETDHVYFGKWSGNPNPNPDEVMDYKWIDPKVLLKHLGENSDDYTYWFKHIIKEYSNKLFTNIK